MLPTAIDLIVDWINQHTQYAADHVTALGDAVLIKDSEHAAFLYLEAYPRWDMKPGIYFTKHLAQGLDPITLPPVGDPQYFDHLVRILRDEPRQF